jgi:hypothetical protein
MKLLLVLFFGILARATTVYVDSNALSATNNSGLATINLTGLTDASPTWAPALPGSNYISYGVTGNPFDGAYFVPPEGTEVTFTTEFLLSGEVTDAVLVVLADYTAVVTLNGNRLTPDAYSPAQNCAGQPPGCLTSSEAVFEADDLDQYLVDGLNILSFGVIELGRGSFGVDFSGTFVDDGSGTGNPFSDPQVQDSTPEPATVACLGAGLLLLGALRRTSIRSLASFGNLGANARQFSPI